MLDSKLKMLNEGQFIDINETLFHREINWNILRPEFLIVLHLNWNILRSEFFIVLHIDLLLIFWAYDEVTFLCPFIGCLHVEQ